MIGIFWQFMSAAANVTEIWGVKCKSINLFNLKTLLARKSLPVLHRIHLKQFCNSFFQESFINGHEFSHKCFHVKYWLLPEL